LKERGMNNESHTRQPLLVDAHVHIYRKTDPTLPGCPDISPAEFTAEQLDATLAQHGVQGCVIAAGSLWGDCNDYICESVRTRPAWRGTVILNPATADRHSMERMAQDGIVGVRFAWAGMATLPDLDSWEYRKLLFRVAELDWHVHILLEGPRLPLLLPRLHQAGVKIVLDHLGRPEREDSEAFNAIVQSIERGRTWLKLSGKQRLGPRANEIARAMLRTVRRDRIVWGSDCPFVGLEPVTYRSAVDWLAELVPDPIERRTIGTDNALALYFKGSSLRPAG